MDIQVVDPDTLKVLRVNTLGSGIHEALADSDVTFDGQVLLPDDHSIVIMLGENSRKRIAVRMDHNVEPVDLVVSVFQTYCNELQGAGCVEGC